ncbi:hypothetical protein ACFVAJ_11075 [Agromyces sp. NPDC057679]|uniref:hypothetical protein n=1 Tax=Agromyces sp. NPDC057679 TaxID=3346207 RepID=UPI00366F69A7
MPSFFNRLKSTFAPEPARVPLPEYATPPPQPSSAGPVATTGATPAAAAPAAEQVGFSTTGMLHKAFFSSYKDGAVANCNLETVLADVRDTAPAEKGLKRCGRCYPNAATRKNAVPRRRSLARRSPELVYLVVPDDEASAVAVKAWFANEYGRIDKDRGIIAVANITDLEPDQLPRRNSWVSSKDTDRLYTLHEEVREGVFQLDDAIREAIKR